MNSTHKVEVFLLENLNPHPNADTLSVIRIADTDYTYVAKTEEWLSKVGTLVAWVPPDSVVKLTRPEFSWLTKDRIRAKKLRGIVSYGLLVPAPLGLNTGDDAAALLEVTHYEPPAVGSKNNHNGISLSNEVASAPEGSYVKYDVESFMKYGRKVFVPGEPVYVTEKLHGANMRVVYAEGKLHVGSRNEWKKEISTPPNLVYDDLVVKVGKEKADFIWDKAVVNFRPKKNAFWMAVPESVRIWCTNNPGYCVYGELYGNVQTLKYGLGNECKFAAFDILRPDGSWLDAPDFRATCVSAGIPTVPAFDDCLFDADVLIALAEGNSLLADHIREGIIVKPVKERWDASVGRVSLKIINPAYLERN